MADHEHDWFAPRKGTRRCRVTGCRAVRHQHEAVHDERRGWVCEHCDEWLSTSFLDGSGEAPTLPPRNPKPRNPRKADSGEGKPNRARRHLEVLR